MKVIFPPRPEGAVPPRELNSLESQGIWCIQPKYEGSRSVILIENGQVDLISRHGREHLNYRMPEYLKKEILALNLPSKCILDAELLNKTVSKDTKGKIVLFDVLAYEEYLFLKPNQIDRIELLSKICRNPKELDSWRGMAYLVSKNIMMAPTFYSNFKQEFDKDYGDEVHGVVLRKKDSVLDNYGSKEYKVNWIVRCRKPHKNYDF